MTEMFEDDVLFWGCDLDVDPLDIFHRADLITNRGEHADWDSIDIRKVNKGRLALASRILFDAYRLLESLFNFNLAIVHEALSWQATFLFNWAACARAIHQAVSFCGSGGLVSTTQIINAKLIVHKVLAGEAFIRKI